MNFWDEIFYKKYTDIDLLEEVQWWNKGEKWIDEHAKYFDDIEKYKRNCL